MNFKVKDKFIVLNELNCKYDFEDTFDTGETIYIDHLDQWGQPILWSRKKYKFIRWSQISITILIEEKCLKYLPS